MGWKRLIGGLVVIIGLSQALSVAGAAQESEEQGREVAQAPDRGPDEGLGPFERLILRGVMVIDGTGAPARGPMDIVIEGNRIEGNTPATWWVCQAIPTARSQP
mgnify:CR=1 FL=1